jgi:PAS domain S-box-containing protein
VRPGDAFLLLIHNVSSSIAEPASVRSEAADKFVRFTAGAVCLVAAVVFAARLFAEQALPAWLLLEPNATAAFCALAGAIVLIAAEEGRQRSVGKLLGALVVLIAGGTVLEQALGLDLRIDALLAPHARSGSLRMTAPAAVLLALLGGSALATDVPTSPHRRLGDLLALGALVVLVQSCLSALFGAGGGHDAWDGIPPVAALLAAGAAAALLAVRFESSALGELLRDVAQNAPATRLLAAALLAPPLVGLLTVGGIYAAAFDAAWAVAFLVTAASSALVAIVWMSASRMRRAVEATQMAEVMHERLARETEARAEAESSRAHYLQLLHDVDAVAWEADLASGELTFLSPGVREMLGESADRRAAGGDFWSSMVHPQDRVRLATGLLAAADEGRDCDFEFRGLRKDGQVRWLRTRLYGEQGENGHRWHRGIMVDVSDRKENEQRLAAQNEVARIFGESPTLPIALPRLLDALGTTLGWDLGAAWTLDRELGVLRCLEVWQASADGAALAESSRGRTLARGEDLPGRVWASGQPVWMADFTREPGMARAADAVRDGMRGAVAVPIRVREEFLGVVELFTSDVRPADDNLTSLLASVGNQIGQFIDRRRSEERHREESAALETVNRLSPTFSGTLDVDKLIQALTDSATQLANAQTGTFFYQTRDAEGYRSYTSAAVAKDSFGLAAPRASRFPTRLFSSDGPLRIDDVRTMSQSAMPGVEGSFGAPTVASYLAVPVVSRTGRILGGLALSHPEPGVFTKREERIVAGIAAHAAVAIDNAELYESERAARQAAEAASRAKDEFLAMLGHELRNPIGAIRNSVEALEVSQARSGDGAGEMLCSIISRQTETLAQLVDDLLDVTRLISGKVRLRTRVVDLMEITSQTLESLRAGGKASRHFLHFSGEPAFVDGDPVRLEQIITNLVENAIKYTPEGGEIEIAVERFGGDAQLRVRDNGQGIDPELLPRIFELFVQGKQSLDRPRGGLGVGLTLVRRLAQLHGGVVEAESAGVGQGSEFRVRMPARAPSEVATADAPADDRRMIPRHVLIAEDHSDSRDSLRLLLEASGHRVDAARNGDEAVELALSTPPEIALIDIGLPGLDGYDVAREIRGSEGAEGVYLVALTGYGQPLDRRRALESGFNEHLVKPLNRDKLLRLMASVLGRSSAPDALDQREQ